MQAIIFKTIGKAENVLEIVEMPVPEPVANQVRVKVLASTLNPADMLFIAGKYRIQAELPQIAGLEGVGLIDKVGADSLLTENTLVAFRHKNIWAEYVLIPDEKLIILPDHFPLAKASQFSLNPITAYALLAQAQLQVGDCLLLTAGNSTVAKIIIQLAQQDNIKVICVLRPGADGSELIALGASEVLFSDSVTLLQDIATITHTQGLSCILDAVGGELISVLIQAVKPLGRLISYGLLSEENVSYHNATLIFNNINIQGFGVDAWLQSISAAEREKMHQTLITKLTDVKFKLPVTAQFKLIDFKEAISTYQNKSNKGKILITCK